MPEQMRELRIVDADGSAIFRIDENGKLSTEEFVVAGLRGEEIFHVDEDGKLVLQELIVTNKSEETIFSVDKNGKVNIGGETDGYLEIKDKGGNLYAFFRSAMLLLFDTWQNNRLSISINALGHAIGLRDDNGHTTVSLAGRKGEIKLRGTDGEDRIWLSADRGDLYLGGNGTDGDLVILPSDAPHAIDNATIHLDGESGDIKLCNADCAEDFKVVNGQEVEPGSVMVIEQEGNLRQSTRAYDKRVAGVISGAGGNNPGIILGRNPSNGKAVPIALSGKVYCKADAGQAPIQVGDLLTTSDTPGYAMKAIDQERSFGCIIGKSLGSLKFDKGLIPILVALQ